MITMKTTFYCSAGNYMNLHVSAQKTVPQNLFISNTIWINKLNNSNSVQFRPCRKRTNKMNLFTTLLIVHLILLMKYQQTRADKVSIIENFTFFYFIKEKPHCRNHMTSKFDRLNRILWAWEYLIRKRYGSLIKDEMNTFCPGIFHWTWTWAKIPWYEILTEQQMSVGSFGTRC